jgi:hypothetical protein
MAIKQALILADVHAPFHDQRALDLALYVGDDLKENLTEIILLGDFADFYNISSHGKDPLIKQKLIDERAEVCKILKDISKRYPQAKKVFVEGNHEYRLARYLAKQAPELFDFYDTSSLLCLEDYGYEFIPYSPNQKYNVLGTDLIAKHQPATSGLHVAHGTVSKNLCSTIFGHVHRRQESSMISISGDEYTAYSVGWLGNKASPVMQYVKNHHNWTLGFAVVSAHEDRWFCDNISIKQSGDKYYCLTNGAIYEN